jgi:16S rRNA processing protein RimM
MARDVLLAAVIGAHGLRGEVKVKTFTATPEAIAQYGALHDKTGARFEITRVDPGKKDEAVVAFRHVNSRNEAEALKGRELFVARAALPEAEEGEFYHTDLIGLRAEDGDGRAIGTVAAILNFGAGDVMVLQRADGDEVFLPFSHDVVPTIDLENGRVIVVEPPDDEAEARHGVE